jgi:hypothetical protein
VVGDRSDGGKLVRPEALKTIGYLVSCASVVLLGLAAYPGAAKAHLAPALFAGMGTSVAGMALRWWSYEVERRSKADREKPRSGPGLDV